MAGPTRTVGEVLEDDHHRIDAHFERFAAGLARGEVDADAYASGCTGLRHHIYVEETLHFPPLKRAGLIGPILVMLREHGEIWDLLTAIDAALAAGQSSADVHELWQQLEQVLAEHNSKEERILYPAGDDALSEEESDDVLTILASQDLPDGWKSEMASI